MPAGRCGMGEKGLDMQDAALPAPGSTCDPKWGKNSAKTLF